MSTAWKPEGGGWVEGPVLWTPANRDATYEVVRRWKTDQRGEFLDDVCWHREVEQLLPTEPGGYADRNGHAWVLDTLGQWWLSTAPEFGDGKPFGPMTPLVTQRAAAAEVLRSVLLAELGSTEADVRSVARAYGVEL